MKENVIVGRLIPAGSGGAAQRIRRIATERDNKIIEERRSEAAAAAALAAPDPSEVMGEDMLSDANPQGFSDPIVD